MRIMHCIKLLVTLIKSTTSNLSALRHRSFLANSMFATHRGYAFETNCLDAKMTSVRN